MSVKLPQKFDLIHFKAADYEAYCVVLRVESGTPIRIHGVWGDSPQEVTRQFKAHVKEIMTYLRDGDRSKIRHRVNCGFNYYTRETNLRILSNIIGGVRL